MATPALRALRSWADARGATIVGVMRPVIEELLEGVDLFDETVSYDKADPAPLLKYLRSLHRSTALLLTNSLRTAWLAWRAGCRRRIGYAQEGRRLLLTDPVTRARWKRRRLPRSAVDDYLDLARVVGAFPDSIDLRLAVTRQDRELAAALWKSWQWLDEQVITFHPGAAFGAAKCWPVAHFARLAEMLLAARPDRRILVLCGPAETETARTIVHQVQDDRIRSVAEFSPSIRLTKGCLARSALLVTGDSGPRHMAAALRIPTVTLFGPTDPCWSHNYHAKDRWLERDLSCRPCARRSCPLQHHRCLQDLLPEQVAAAAKEWLACPALPAAG